MQEIDGSKYYFDENGYIQTGWVSVGFDDYYFNDDGTYDPNTHKPRIALSMMDRENIQMNFWIVWKRIMRMRHSLCWDRTWAPGSQLYREW